jgi:thioredoxin-like negative regulator of GroEL
MQQGKREDAQEAIASALTLSKKSSDVTIRLPLTIQNAYAQAEANNLVEAKRLHLPADGHSAIIALTKRLPGSSDDED